MAHFMGYQSFLTTNRQKISDNTIKESYFDIWLKNNKKLVSDNHYKESSLFVEPTKPQSFNSQRAESGSL